LLAFKLVLDHDGTCSLGGISSESLLLRLTRLITVGQSIVMVILQVM